MTTPLEDPRHVFGPINVDREGNDLNWFVSSPFVRYDPKTGEILEDGQMSVAAIKRHQSETGSAYLMEAGGYETHFVDLASLTVREKSECPALLEDGSLHRLPSPCRIEISHSSTPPTIYLEEESSVALEFDHPGRYRVRILSVQHLPALFEVEVS